AAARSRSSFPSAGARAPRRGRGPRARRAGRWRRESRPRERGPPSPRERGRRAWRSGRRVAGRKRGPRRPRELRGGGRERASSARRRACARRSSGRHRKEEKRGEPGEREACGRGPRGDRKDLAKARVFRRLDLAFLELVDGRERLGKALRVRRAEVAPARRARDALEQRLVHVDVRTHAALRHAPRLGVADGNGNLDGSAIRPDAHGIDAHAERFRDPRGGIGVDLAGVVPAIRHEDDDARLRLGRLQARERVSESEADGRAVALIAELEARETVEDHAAIRRERTDGTRAPGENEEADAVARASLDKLARAGLRDEEPVPRLEVLRGHRARGVERDEDVDTFRPRLRPLEAEARPRERDYETGVAGPRQRERQVPEAHAPRRADPGHVRERRHDERAVPALLAEDPERDRERNEEKEKEQERVAKRQPPRA